ncbi:MAG: hypothetical protein IPL61_27745 [Myxococcales bacterium]|nr:hypothetical protein [Myxococcales bacterium]
MATRSAPLAVIGNIIETQEGSAQSRRTTMRPMIAHLDSLRAQLAAADPAARATAAVRLAEDDPLLGHRAAVVRANIHAAGPLVEPVEDPALEARLLLRLASIKMIELDWTAADSVLSSAGERIERTGPLMFAIAARSCRVGIRRGDRAVAGPTLRGAAGVVAAQADARDPLWQQALAEITLGIAEDVLHDEPGDPAPFDELRALVDELRHEPRWVDTVFTARQVLATDALARGDAATAANQLREIVRIATEHASPADEIEARIARAAALAARGDLAGAEEADRVIQIARDRALEHGLTDLHVAALIGQAGLMSQRNKTAGALDRCIEVARIGAAGGDLGRYVAAVGLMSQIYQNHGDYPSAYRTIAESYHALRQVQGDGVRPMFERLIESLRDHMGRARFTKMIDDVSRARRLADELTSSPSA